MLNWSVLFFVIAMMAGLVSFFRLTAATGFISLVSLLFLLLSILSLIAGLRATRARLH